MNDVVQRALEARIVQLETQVKDRGDLLERQSGRIDQLETALNNVLGAFPAGEAKVHYQAVLDYRGWLNARH